MFIGLWGYSLTWGKPPLQTRPGLGRNKPPHSSEASRVIDLSATTCSTVARMHMYTASIDYTCLLGDIQQEMLHWSNIILVYTFALRLAGCCLRICNVIVRVLSRPCACVCVCLCEKLYLATKRVIFHDMALFLWQKYYSMSVHCTGVLLLHAILLCKCHGLQG